jgi:pectinesterase
MKSLNFATILLVAATRCSGHHTLNQTWATSSQESYTMFPTNGAKNVNPDTHLVLTFPSPPKIGTSGFIKVYHADTKKLIDTIDMSIPPSSNPLGRDPNNKGTTTAPKANPNDKTVYQTNTIGGFDYRFFPIIVRGNVATIYLHNNMLKYGQTYNVKIDSSVLKAASGAFAGFTSDTAWTFSTKAAPPPPDSTKLTVAADGTGDFNTVQGAIDSLPAKPTKKVTIFIKNGSYEEIVVISNKSNFILRGESREKVKVGYSNNSAFNMGGKGGGPSRRVAFTIYKSNDIQLSSFTVINYFIGQAEAMLINGERVILDHMTLNGSGDAFTTYGTIYFADSKLTGHGDTVLGYGAVFFLRSEIHSIGPMTWTRTPQGKHGNIFVNSSLVGIDEPLPWTVTSSNPAGKKSEAVFARLPRNGPEGSPTSNFPYAEMVLINTKTKNIASKGWGAIQAAGFDHKNVHFWEYNTMDMSGRPVDTSRRENVVSRRLTMEKDAKIISDYSRPEFVLSGWNPVIV